MISINKITSVLPMIVLVSLVPVRTEAQAFTEFRDPLRGATLYSVQVSTDALTNLQVEGSRFGSSDRMTLGFSAFFFDESDVVDDYVLWLRHDGPRRWFTGADPRPLRIDIDREIIELTPLHALRPTGAPDAGPFVEKLEFTLSPAQFQSILDADSVTIELSTLLGLVEKRLSAVEIEAIRSFNEGTRLRHNEAKSGLTSK